MAPLAYLTGDPPPVHQAGPVTVTRRDGTVLTLPPYDSDSLFRVIRGEPVEVEPVAEPELGLCRCGCGGKTTRSTSRWLQGHNMLGGRGRVLIPRG